MSGTDHRLIGRWLSQPGEPQRVTIEFQRDGSMIYTIHEPDKDQKMFLRYRVENGTIISDQGSAPREERTAYWLEGDHQLVLSYEGERSVFRRA